MIAYNRQYLDNKAIQDQAGEALAKGAITAEESDNIRAAYPSKLYTPNFFVRIGLFLLTVLAAACGLGLFMLASPGGSNAFGTTIIFYGILAYAALELFIHTRGIYRAGVDDALLWTGSGLILSGIYLLADHISSSVLSLLVLILALAGALRYLNRLMAVVAYGALLSLIFYSVVEAGATERAFLPFTVMAVSIACYIGVTRLTSSKADGLRHYHSALILLRAVTLLSFYLAGNYYIVREVNASLSGGSDGSGPIALGFLWWSLTVIIPIFYIFSGIQKKDTVFLWTGLALVAAAIFTVRYYYHVLPAELAMVIGGSILIAGAYALIRYLHPSKAGFTSAAPDEPHILQQLPVEGLILAESFKTAAQPEDPGFRFGGGSGGGGGAGGEF